MTTNTPPVAPTDNTALVDEMENLRDRNGKPPLTKEEMARFRELFPLDYLSRVALAAWVNVRPDQLPQEMQAHNCPATMEAWARVAEAICTALASREATPAAQEPVAFQDRVRPWMDACFGPAISGDRLERGDRLLEDVLELLQSGGYPRDRIAALTGYVWSRPVGDPAQEVGGVMVTLAAYCLAHGIDMHDAGETELARIWTKIEKIRAKQAAKPTGSALPQAWPDSAPPPAA